MLRIQEKIMCVLKLGYPGKRVYKQEEGPGGVGLRLCDECFLGFGIAFSMH